MNKEKLTLKQKKAISLITVALFVIFCVAVGLLIGKPMLELFSRPEQFRDWVDSKGILGKIAFIGMVFFQVVIAFVPGEPLEIGAGYAFGGIEGTILCIIGIALGSALVFWLVRKYGIRLVEVFFSREKINSLKFLKDKRKRGLLIFLVFFLPGTPKDLITYFVGITDISFKHFIFLAAFARLPSIITSTMGGGALGSEKYASAIIVFAVAALLSVLGLLIYNKFSKKHKKD